MWPIVLIMMHVLNHERRLRILHVLNHTARANGHVCAVVDLACTQADLGHQVFVCSSGGDFDPLLSRHGIVHLKIGRNRNLATLGSAALEILTLLRDIKPDIVHAHMMTSALIVACLAPLCQAKLVTTVHNEFQRSAILMRVGQRVIGVSEFVSRSMIRRGIPAAKVRTVLNGTLTSPRFSQAVPPSHDLLHPAIMFVGGLHPRKGVDDLIRAFGSLVAEFPCAHLHIVGDGPYRDAYTAQAALAAPGAVTFHGHSDDPLACMRAADIFVLASHAEPAGLVLSEAREAGCAIVASDVDGIPEMLEHGQAGILVPPRRPDLLTQALARLLRDPAYLAEMRTRSQVNIGKLSLRRVARETLSIYHELIPCAVARASDPVSA
jgi:glycosyltransferase involved in cell wall biosynthesis